MEFDTEQLEILYRAKLLGAERGQVLEDWAYPSAHRLAEAGWLQRRFVGDELAWFLAPTAELAFELHGLTEDAKNRQN